MRQCLDVVRDGDGYRVIFEREKDRYAHSIELVRDTEKHLLMRSLEGDDHCQWPPSPPLQQLSFERRPDGSPIVLAIGMAGSSHWSLSIETNLEDLASEFDIACRCVMQPERLGSIYQVTAADCLANSQLLQFSSPFGSLQLMPMEHGPAEPIGRLTWDAQQQQAEITPASSQLANINRVWTVRWRYRVQWISG